MRVVTTLSEPPAAAPPRPRPRAPPVSQLATDTPCHDGAVAADVAVDGAAPNWNRRDCVTASSSILSVASPSHVMCSLPGARITPPAPYALHCSPACSSFAGSHALAMRLPSADRGRPG